MNRRELKLFFDDKLRQYSEIYSREQSLREKLCQIRTMPDDSLIQMNLGTCVFSVPKEQAVNLLYGQIEVECKYDLLMHERFMKAVGIINGEED